MGISADKYYMVAVVPVSAEIHTLTISVPLGFKNKYLKNEHSISENFNFLSPHQHFGR
jgi:hypothetical protein